MAPTTLQRSLPLVAGLLLAVTAVGGSLAAAADAMTTISGRVRTMEGGSLSQQPNAHVTVVVVDEKGRIVASQATDDAFQLAIPSERDYVLMVSRDGEDVGVLVWGDEERSEFFARGPRVDLGYVGLNATTRRAVALREIDLRAPRGNHPVLLTTEE